MPNKSSQNAYSDVETAEQRHKLTGIQQGGNSY